MPNDLRDVEFDIALGAGRPLTVSATPQGRERGTRFFIPSQNKWATQVTFPEGRPFKIQVPRDYLGHLLIQQGSRTITRLQLRGLVLRPTSLEPVRYRLRPAAAAPASNRPANLSGPPLFQADNTRVALRRPPPTPPPGYNVFVHKVQGAPVLREGPHNLNTVSTQERGWFMRMVYGTELPDLAKGLYIARELMRDFDARFYIKRGSDGAYYVVFQGYAGLRRHLTATRYRLENTKVVSFTGGATTVRQGAVSGLRSMGSTPSIVTLLFVGVMDVAEWMQDGNKPFTDLLVDLGLDVLKATVGAAIASGIIAGLAGLVAGVSIPLVVAVAGGIALGLLIGWVLDQVDSRLGIGESLKRVLRNGVDEVDRQFDNFRYELQHGLYELERWMMTGGGQLPLGR